MTDRASPVTAAVTGSTSNGLEDHSDLWAHLPRQVAGRRALGLAALLTAAATVIGMGLSLWLPQQSVLLVYFLSVVLAAIGFGVSTGLTSAVLAFFAYNFFFIEPTYTFTIADRRELFSLIVFFAVALLTGSLAGRMRETADAARRRAATLQSLNDFAALLSGANTQSVILDALAAQAAATVRGEAIVLMTADGELKIRASAPLSAQLEPVEWQVAERTLRSGETSFAAAPGWPGARHEFRPLTTAHSTIGVIGLAPSSGERRVAADDEAALEMILRHTSIAIERTELEAEASSARAEAERERMRSALLSSISHDLRTPLASILGAVTSLRQLGPGMTPETRADLLIAIEEETGRLARFVSNLLDMTRLDTETLDLNRDWVDAGDAVQIAVARAKRLFPAAAITLSVTQGLPIIRGDATLFEHVAFNLIDNAVKFSNPDQTVLVALSASGGVLTLTVTDHGRGIPKDDVLRIFDKFYRVRGGDRDVPGTGLGLTICKRIVEAMGGTIEAESPVENGKGTRVAVRLPVPEAGLPITAEF